MRRYGSKKVRKGASTQSFSLLSAAEQIERVKKLHASKVPVQAIADLTGLGTQRVMQMLESI